MEDYNTISSVLMLTNVTPGIYEALLVWNNQQCSSYHMSNPLNLNQVVLTKAKAEVKFYGILIFSSVSYHIMSFTIESLNHSFTTSKKSLSSDEVASLTCSATIRYPPLTSISMLKNNITIRPDQRNFLFLIPSLVSSAKIWAKTHTL